LARTHGPRAFSQAAAISRGDLPPTLSTRRGVRQSLGVAPCAHPCARSGASRPRTWGTVTRRPPAAVFRGPASSPFRSPCAAAYCSERPRPRAAAGARAQGACRHRSGVRGPKVLQHSAPLGRGVALQASSTRLCCDRTRRYRSRQAGGAFFSGVQRLIRTLTFPEQGRLSHSTFTGIIGHDPWRSCALASHGASSRPIPTEGAAGLLNAVDVVWPRSRRMRGWFPKRPHRRQKVPPPAWAARPALGVDRRAAPPCAAGPRRVHALLAP
jgi:hypothetical protein